jgi:hypothetical protein
MSYVIVAPEIMTSAATDLATAPTVAVVPAAADEVSAGVAQLFSQHAADYEAAAARAAAFHQQFVQNLTTGAFSYASVENAVSSSLQDLLSNTGGYLLGGVGKVGLLPQIAWDIYRASNSGNPLGLLLRPLDLLLFPLDLVYSVESGMTHLGIFGF